MMKYRTHICIVSKQADANLLPISNKETRPEKVILLASPEMATEATYLQEAIKDWVQVDNLSLKNAYDIVSLQEDLIDCLTRYENEDIVVNITGGTKPMAIAAVNVCSQQFPYFYQNITNNEIYLWTPDSPKVSVQKLNNYPIRIQRYLKAHGYEFNEQACQVPTTTDDEEEFIDRMLGGNYGSGIGALNYYSSNAEGSLVSPAIEPNDMLEFILDKPIELKWIKTIKKNGKTHLQFINEEKRRFLNGTWLEKCVFNIVSELIPGTKVYQSAVVKHGKNKNEFDVMFIYNNRLHLIEVKTCIFKQNNNNQDIVHKLTSLADDVGGLSAKRCIVSYYPLDSYLTARAKDKNTEVISDNLVRNRNQLKGLLKKWISK